MDAVCHQYGDVQAELGVEKHQAMCDGRCRALREVNKCGRRGDLNNQLCARQQLQNCTAKARGHVRVHNNALDGIFSMNLVAAAQIKPDQLKLPEETFTPDRKKPVVAKRRNSSDGKGTISVIPHYRFGSVPP